MAALTMANKEQRTGAALCLGGILLSSSYFLQSLPMGSAYVCRGPPVTLSYSSLETLSRVHLSVPHSLLDDPTLLESS